MQEEAKLSPNSISFIGLSNEYCKLLENAREVDREEFINSMTKLLPRLYITATDLTVDEAPDMYIESHLDEDYYENIRHYIEMLMGPDDIYLEVFEEDMKYSDTPIAASIAESLADIFQDLFNFISSIKESPADVANQIIAICKENFENYWGQTLCNVLRALNNLKYKKD